MSPPPLTTESPSHYSPPLPPIPTLRRPTRIIIAPQYSKDFHCHQTLLAPFEQSFSKDALASNGKSFPLSKCLSYHRFNPSFQAFISSLSLQSEPNSNKQA